MNEPGIDNVFIPSNPDEEVRPMLLIRNTILAVKPAFEHVLGMTQARVFMLLLLKTQDEISQTEIYKHLGVDRALITRLVKHMEADGLVERRTDPADNRYTLVRLSEKGGLIQTQIMERIRDVEKSLLFGMSEEEVECLRRGLVRIRINAEAISNGARYAGQLNACEVD